MESGRLFIKGITELTQGTHYNYTVGGHSLIKSTRQPTNAEVTALRMGEATFGMYVNDGVIFFLCRIGNGPWTASHYNWWLNAPGLRPDPLAELGARDLSIRLRVELVDAVDGAVVAENAFVISDEPAAVLRRSVLDQIEGILDPWDHLHAAGRLLGRSSDLGWMATEALWLECCRLAQDGEIPEETRCRR